MAILGFPLAAGACDSDDDATSDPTPVEVVTTADPPTTPAPSPPTTPTTTEPTSTVPPTTAPPATTDPPSTTIDEEALKAQIAEDLAESRRLILSLVQDPSLDRLEERAARAVAPGEYFEVLVTRVRELVELGDRLQPGNPPIETYTVESVLQDPADRREAVAIVCEVSNSQQVTPAAGPNGEDVIVEGTDGLVARRYEQHVVQTDFGWRPDEFQDRMLGLWNEVDSCPPA